MGNFLTFNILFCIFFTLRLLTSVTLAQNPDFHFDILQKGASFSDSSYYDIVQMAPEKYWAFGEYGIITEINGGSSPASVQYPNRGIDLYDAVQFNDGHFIFAGDSGTLLYFQPNADLPMVGNRSSGTWEYRNFPEYKKFCFYKIARVNDSVAVLCGGKSALTARKKAIPHGFIMITSDGGKTWRTIYRHPLYMVWCVKYDADANKLFALLYTPGRSKLISTSPDKIDWQTEQKVNGLYHDVEVSADNYLFSGSANMRFAGNGSLFIRTVNSAIEFSSGFLWDVETNGTKMIGCGSNGNLIVHSLESGLSRTIKSPVENNLYKVFFLSGRSALVAGNGKTLMTVRWE